MERQYPSSLSLYLYADLLTRHLQHWWTGTRRNIETFRTPPRPESQGSVDIVSMLKAES
jgi:hypothetical protein